MVVLWLNHLLLQLEWVIFLLDRPSVVSCLVAEQVEHLALLVPELGYKDPADYY